VLGVGVDGARTQLDAAGFTVVVSSAYDATYPAGTVVGQQPASGAGADAGSTVTLTVAARTGVAATVPDVLGTDRSAAEAGLASAGLSAAVGVVASCAGGTGCAATLARDAGRVWRQDVPAGSRLPVGSSVGLAVGP
jgi:beta-lactam-binding protein with PASTA domain